jgi:hypothetical protein
MWKRAAGLAMAALFVAGAACGPDTKANRSRDTDIGFEGGAGSTASDNHRTAQIYAAVIRQLVLKDDTFGGPNPYFKRVFVFERVVRRAGNPMGSVSQTTSGELLSADVKQQILKLSTDLPPTRFISRRGAVIGGKSANDPIGRVVHDGVLITLGPIRHSSSGVQVPNNLWVSGLAGQWLTYVLTQARDGWQITGTAGPVAIS